VTKLKVVVGPYRAAKRYAQSRGWSEEEYVVVTRGHQLARLDPAKLATIFTVKINGLGQRAVGELREEADRLKALWPVPILTAA
jgi:hypothetical protein